MVRTKRVPVVRPVATARRSFASTSADVLTFVVAVGGSFVLTVGGDLPVADVLLVPLLPILIVLKPQRLQRARLKNIFVLLAVWLLGEIIADVYRGSDLQDWLRVDSRIFFIAANILCLAVLVGRNMRRHYLFLAGYGVGSVLSIRLQPNGYNDLWKFGYASGVTTLVVLLSCYFYKRRNFPVVILILLGIAGVHLGFDFRSPVLFLLITIVLVTPVIPEKIGNLRILPSGNSKGRVLVLAVLALAAGGAAGKLVTFLSTEGVLGESARIKNEVESRSKGGILLGGRPEVLVSSRAFLEMPFIGHGAWARDMKYVEMNHDLQVEWGMSDDKDFREEDLSGLIPTHSHLMDALVDAGILGAGFWCYVLYLIAKGLSSAALNRPPLAPIYIYSLILFFWNVLFSPAGGINILPEAFMLIVVLDLLTTTNLSKPKVLVPLRTRQFRRWQQDRRAISRFEGRRSKGTPSLGTS
jgi:hypothetical protein